MSLNKLVDFLEEELKSSMSEITDDVISHSYIGGSSIGHACERSVALRMRGFPVDKRPRSSTRLLRMGHILEEEILTFIQALINDHPTDLPLQVICTGEDQRQYQMGVIKASPDGVIYDSVKGVEVGLIEIKSANDASFNSTKRLGVRYAHPEYYDQMQMLMGLADLDTTLFVMTNKNNSNILAENVRFDTIEYHYLLARSEYIADGNDTKCAKVSTDFRCNFCSYKQVCWFNAPVREEQRTCRHCIHSSIPPLDTDNFSICNHPKGQDVEVHISLEEKRKVAIVCPYFTDYRDKDLKTTTKSTTKSTGKR